MTAPTDGGRSRAQAQAEARQRQASDPLVSAFVSASAGSGKTKLLIDRLLRLLLSGVDPARVQCLTFTKAAAAEMQLRLQKRLGIWVSLDDPALDCELGKLEQAKSADNRRLARKLFAQVLDLPGGMRIGTIHAFCQSLLRRFPLEARLSPHFRLVDDVDGAMALRDAREDMLTAVAGGDMLAAVAGDDMRGLLDAVAGLTKLEEFGQRVGDLRLDRSRLEALRGLEGAVRHAAQRRALGVSGTHDEAGLIAAAVGWAEEETVAEALGIVERQGAPRVRANAAAMLAWLAGGPQARAALWPDWHRFLHKADGAPRALSGLVNDKLHQLDGGLQLCLGAEQSRVGAIEDQRLGIRIARISHALTSLSLPVIDAYARRKDSAALLDYDDLIGHTGRLLIDPGAAWVLYKLDGGIDHLLLDEVQDTAPAQWDIAGALTQEFFAGRGAADGRRTIFAVGDRKQSIYSFQGADPDQFERWRGILGQRVQDAGEQWQKVELDVSFRSTAPVLALVDAVFQGPLASPGVIDDPASPLAHIASRADQAGRVELWPLAPRPQRDPPQPWTVPERNLGSVGAPQRLATALARWIGQSCGTLDLPSRGRTLAPGDVLVLVRRRNDFPRALVRALKAEGVPVAGLDRLVLTDQPAVADLLALCDTLLLPEDDLSLACVLTSPLGGLSDDSLMELAPSRKASLWAALRARAGERADWAAARRFIETLLARVDYVGPHALLAEALGPLGGRARLFARLGPEAAEPVDELLNAALRYARVNPPSLQGFVHWQRHSGAEVKREAEGAGAAVRIMTVHGAKGLQAPVVILPDTTALPPDKGQLLWGEDGGHRLPLWSPLKALRNSAIDGLRATAAARREEEQNRLLYVALTRAEDRLIVCGWQPYRPPAPNSWYELVRAGFAGLDTKSEPFTAVPDAWDGELLVHASPQAGAADRVGEVAPAAATEALPAWAGAAPDWVPRPAPSEPARPLPLAPSRPENAGLGQVPQAESPLAGRDAGGQRFVRGQLVHSLLQHLPALPAARRHAAAVAFLARPGSAIPSEAASALAAEVMAVLDHPALAPLFGPEGRAEVPLTGVVGGLVVGGLVDRLAVLADRVVIADYKTNRAPPADVAATPALYLRQMAAYRAVLREIFPGRPVACALVWTAGATVMPLPDALLDRHAPGIAAPPA